MTVEAPNKEDLGTGPEAIPCAKVVEGIERRQFLWWLIPLVSGIVSISLFLYANNTSGKLIEIAFQDGHGLKPNDVLRHKGIEVGQVEKIELAKDLTKVRVAVRLAPSASSVAKEGARFWVVRPRVSFDAIGGLETILGAKFIAMEPGPVNAKDATSFVGLEEAPLATPKAGSLELTLDSPTRHGLTPNAPIVYRGYRIGSVVEIGIASDARSVRARCAIDPEFRDLVRTNTKFWNHSGWKLNIGITGLQLDAETLPQLLTGSIEMGTPDQSGEPVKTGHHFQLYEKAEDEWLKWSPSIGFGDHWSKQLNRVPVPQRIALRWQERLFGFRTNSQSSGWCLPLSDGSMLAIRRQVQPSDRALDGSIALELLGLSLTPESMEATSVSDSEDLDSSVRIKFSTELPGDLATWPVSLVQPVTNVQETRSVIVIHERIQSSIRIDATRLTPSGDNWFIDRSIAFVQDSDGLPVIDAESNRVIGVLSVSGDAPKISLVTRW